MILIFIFCFLLLNVNALCGEEQASLQENHCREQPNEKINTFLNALSQEQRATLENFFRLVVKDHYSGYVLFGDKPVCIESYSPEFEDIDLPGIYQANVYVKWMKLWRELEINPKNKSHFFIDLDAYGYHHIICINRKTFLQTVNDNLHLFRYALGPTLTAENLLNELIQAKENFYDVLKDDNVLLGILLGYGTENALLISRRERLDDSFAKDHHEDFPFIAKKIRYRQTKLPKMQSRCPSLGYDSLSEESEVIKEITTTSSELKSFKECEIPHFGCNPDSQETQDLIARYATNRSAILQILEGENFLEETLKKLFTTTSQTLEIPKVLPISEYKETSVTSPADFLYHDIKSKECFHESYLKACLEGMHDCQNGTYASRFFEDPDFAMVKEMVQIEKDLRGIKNLEKADAYFNDLKEFAPLIPKKIYYKVIKEGIGTPLSIKANQVSFHHSSIIMDEHQTKNAGTVKEESLEHLIPGIAIALIGMKQGEEREVYIHPEYGYGENSYLEPNVAIMAKIELLGFSEGDEETVLFPPHLIDRRNYDELLTRHRELCCKECYDSGALFINALKNSKQKDPKAIQQCFDLLNSALQLE